MQHFDASHIVQPLRLGPFLIESAFEQLVVADHHGSSGHSPHRLQQHGNKKRVYTTVCLLMPAPIIVVLNAQLEGDFVAMIGVTVYGESQTWTLQQLGHQADSIGPATVFERAVVASFDKLGKGLERNIGRLGLLGNEIPSNRILSYARIRGGTNFV